MTLAMKSRFLVGIATATALLGGEALAEAVTVEAMLAPQEQMKYEFADGSKHFVLAVRREGKFEGSGAFAGATVTEFGWHDVNFPVEGKPIGYLQVTTASGDVAVLRWRVDAAFLKGEEKPKLINSGLWELIRGTGQFAGQRGVGSLVLQPAGGPTKFILKGDIGDKP